MAQLLFEKIIDLTPEASTLEKLLISNEPSNELWQYYMTNGFVHDKSAQILLANYDNLSWSEEGSNITTKVVKDFGVKTFPGIGSFGFFTPTMGASKVLLPLHLPKTPRYKAPTLNMIDNEETLTFNITAPTDITYMCYRILIQKQYEAFEYITYETSITVNKPTVKGNYECYCIGYVNEGDHISEESNHIALSITTGTDISEPIGPAYYTKAEIDAMFRQIIEEKPTQALISNH